MSLLYGDIVRTSCRFKNSISGDVVNVYHWEAAGAISDSDDDIMDAIETKLDAMYTDLNTHLMSEQDPYDIRHDVVDWIGGKEKVVRVLGTRSWSLTNPPSNTQDGLPQMDCAIVNGRTGRPQTFARKYIGALSEGNIADGSLTSTVLTALSDYITEWLTSIALTGGDLVACVLSKYENPSGYNWWPIVSGVANAIIGTQRRRRINRGS